MKNEPKDKIIFSVAVPKATVWLLRKIVRLSPLLLLDGSPFFYPPSRMQAHALGASSSAAGVTSSVGAAGAAALLLRPRPSQMRRHRTVFTAAAAEGAGPSGQSSESQQQQPPLPPLRPPLKKASGLARTPSGGLAAGGALTSTDLPPPAVAVRNLIELAQYAHLASNMSQMHHRRAGYPFATLVDFASDGAGFPIFNLSPLAMHTRNLLEDPRACLVVEMPGWSGLANARVTIFGEVGPLPEELQEAGRELFAAKQVASEELLAAGVNNGNGVVSSSSSSSSSAAVLPANTRKNSSSPGSPQKQKQRGFVSGNATLFRMHRISDIYFVGGFGTVSWVDPAEYAAARPDAVASVSPRATLFALNEAHSSAVARLLSSPDGSPADDAAFISVDARGADVRLRRGAQYGIERLAFSRGSSRRRKL